MNRTAKIIVCILSAAVILWSAIFLTDLTLVRNGGEPVFVVVFATADDGGWEALVRRLLQQVFLLRQLLRLLHP